MKDRMNATNGRHAVFITGDYPAYEYRGDYIYAAQLIDILSGLYDTVDVICNEVEEEFYPEGGREKKFNDNVNIHFYKLTQLNAKKKIFTTLPYSALKQNNQEGRHLISGILNGDHNDIFIDHIKSSWALPVIKKCRKDGSNIIYITHNEEFGARVSILKNIAKTRLDFSRHLIDALRVRYTDKRVFRASKGIVCISSNDARKYRERFLHESIEVVPPLYSGTTVNEKKIDTDIPRKICLVGSYTWYAKKINIESFLNVAYEKMKRDKIEIAVIGNMEDDYRRMLEHKWEGVTFTGKVASVEKYLESCRIGIIAEKSGSGFKMKTLTYVFNRVPIFALNNSVVDVPLKDRESIALYRTSEELVAGIVRDIDNIEYLNRLQNNAYESCEAYLDPEDQKDRMRKAVFGRSPAGAGQIPLPKNSSVFKRMATSRKKDMFFK